MAAPVSRGQIQADIVAFRADEAGIRRLLKRNDTARMLARRAIRVESAAKQYATGVDGGPNVRTGRLRASITWRLGEDGESVYADVGSNVEYCVFDAHTSITTATGVRTIGQLRPGEKVLTQTGDFQTVLAVSRFEALRKPELVDLTVPWRKDKAHRLTLTLDHKVLAQREGRNLWVPAGDLRDGDLVFDRIKIAHNIGTRTVKECEECGRRHTRQGRRYCSVSCRNAAWAKGANPHIGMKRSAETRAKLTARATERRSGIALNRKLAERGRITDLERQVMEWLETRGVIYLHQHRIGPHVVDFYLPEEGEVIEADGAYWHQNQAADIARDREILADAPGVEITHLHFHDPRFTPPIDSEPIPGVRYVVCNPGPSSYVDPAKFQAKPVRIERHWTYGQKNFKPKGRPHGWLYDVSVESVHSFIANGVLISNSVYVEMGTSRMAARPFLVPALSAARDD
jgi:very-short-patch-repair endonuclease